jgi:hypothetical protein
MVGDVQITWSLKIDSGCGHFFKNLVSIFTSRRRWLESSATIYDNDSGLADRDTTLGAYQMYNIV